MKGFDHFSTKLKLAWLRLPDLNFDAQDLLLSLGCLGLSIASAFFPRPTTPPDPPPIKPLPIHSREEPLKWALEEEAEPLPTVTMYSSAVDVTSKATGDEGNPESLPNCEGLVGPKRTPTRAPKLNLNQASLEALVARFPGLGAKRAAHILDYREKYRGFRSLEELSEVPGVGPRWLQTLKAGLTL